MLFTVLLSALAIASPAAAAPASHTLEKRANDKIRLTGTNFCFDVMTEYGEVASGNPIQMWECHGHDNQRWQLDGDVLRLSQHPDVCLGRISRQSPEGVYGKTDELSTTHCDDQETLLRVAWGTSGSGPSLCVSPQNGAQLCINSDSVASGQRLKLSGNGLALTFEP